MAEDTVPMVDELLAKGAWRTVEARNTKYVNADDASGVQAWKKDPALPKFFRSAA